MALEIQKEKIRMSEVTHSMRASQAVLQYGVGAMVDFPDQTLMTAAPEYWKDQTEEIHDERLERVLRVSHFRTPGNKGESKFREGISYARFPEWYFCPRCRKFQPISKWIEDYQRVSKFATDDPYMVRHMNCPKCRQELIVTRIVSVCECGHIDDFPWVKWVHSKNRFGSREICNNPSLEFMTSKSSSEGLDAIEIRCSCGARASLREAFNKNAFDELDRKTHGAYDFTCTGRHPWKNTKENCTKYPVAKQRGSSSVYFPYIESSLVIPPYSNLLTKSIEESQAFQTCKNTLSALLNIAGLDASAKAMMKKQQIDVFANQIGMEISVAEEKVKAVLERRWLTPEDDEYTTTSNKYRSEEYEALLGEIKVNSDEYDSDFRLETTNVSDYQIPFVKNVSLIHKIREVQALTGFTRLTPAEKGPDGKMPQNLISIKEPQTDWYPAYQVRGEGIFIEIDHKAIKQWRNNNQDLENRVAVLNENYSKSYFGKNNPRVITDRYLLLHTLSHLLIKQLSFECGYGIASLKERIYCSEPEEGKEMSGILIYTASGDSEGTLGGLVRQGRSDLLPNIFKKAIETAMTCSNDPVCGLSLGQGRDSLNLAACYSCTLIPETSCEVFNVFLDRGTIVGTFENRNMGFYSEYLYGDKSWKTTGKEEKTEIKKEKNTYKTTKIIVIQDGTLVSEMNYCDIWKSVNQWINDDEEKKIIEGYAKDSQLFEGKEKPESECDFKILGEEGNFGCDLVWKNSKVMFFTSENYDDYCAAQNSGWICVFSKDGRTSKELAELLKG